MKQVLISSSESNAVCTTKVTSQEDFENKNIVPQHRIIEDFLTLLIMARSVVIFFIMLRITKFI
jgi:hypothetical protein